MGYAEVLALFAGYDAKTPAEKALVQKEAARERARSAHQNFPPPPYTISKAGGRKATVTAVSLGDDYVELTMEFKRGGTTFPFSNPWRIVRPPLLFPDPIGTIVLGGETYREDALEVMRAIIERKLDEIVPP